METLKEKGPTLTLVYGKSVSGGYIGYLKEFPGAASQGGTLDELRANIADAILALFDANRVLAEERKHLFGDSNVGEEHFSLQTS